MGAGPASATTFCGLSQEQDGVFLKGHNASTVMVDDYHDSNYVLRTESTGSWGTYANFDLCWTADGYTVGLGYYGRLYVINEGTQGHTGCGYVGDLTSLNNLQGATACGAGVHELIDFQCKEDPLTGNPNGQFYATNDAVGDIGFYTTYENYGNVEAAHTGTNADVWWQTAGTGFCD